MPFVLAKPIDSETPSRWAEGKVYERHVIYRTGRTDHPPVNYDRHLLAPHSLCHADAPSHVLESGPDLVSFYDRKANQPYWGEAWVAKIPMRPAPHRVSLEELQNGLSSAGWRAGQALSRLLLSCDPCPLDERGLHDDAQPFVLSIEAAAWLAQISGFCLFGTSWKSIDFEPNSRTRPIHNVLLSKGPVFELLDLAQVPEGRYFWVGAPLPLVGASEAPAAPLLFTASELRDYLHE